VARDLPGEIAQVAVDEDETYLRQNFDRSDNRNFRDGDKQSSRQYRESFGDEENPEGEENSVTGKMYNSPTHNVEVDDSTGALISYYDNSDKSTSLSNDEVRVYKGGSWKDRVYWLDPTHRRDFPRPIPTDPICLRCAMSRVGSKSKNHN